MLLFAGALMLVRDDYNCEVLTNIDLHSRSPNTDFKMSAGHQNTLTFSWQNGPMRLISLPISTSIAPTQYTRVAIEITLAYNSLIRALNSIYIQCPHVPMSEYPNFTAYTLATYHGLQAYDNSNEHTFFSELARRTGETRFMQGHRAFDASLCTWGNWLESIANRRNNFNPDMCRAMMDDFLPALHAHMHVVPECLLYVSQFERRDLDVSRLAGEHREKVFGGMSRTREMPVFVMNHDEGFGGGGQGFLGKSKLEMWVLREVCARKFGEWWKFSTVGFDGKSREVRFLRG
jgi:hypothetical protein